MNTYSQASRVGRTRRLTILSQLLGTRRFGSQDELARALERAGVSVTQATLSRDLRSLGAGKEPGAGGKSVYRLPVPAAEALDRSRQLLDLRSFVNEVRVARNLVVVKTPPGHANAVGRAIDLLEFDGTVGSVAGDDTLLVVMAGEVKARALRRHLDRLAAAPPGARETA